MTLASEEVHVPPTFYSVYELSDEKLGQIFSNLNSENEMLLQSFLTRRLKKGAIYSGTGNFSVMDFSVSNSSPSSPAMCFYILLPSKAVSDNVNEQQMIICFLTTQDVNMEVFRLELTKLCENISSKVPLCKGCSDQDENLVLLAEWYSECVLYVCRVLGALGMQVAALLQLAQMNSKLKVAQGIDSKLSADVQRFLSVCSVADCLPPNDANVLKDVILSEDLQINVAYCNAFCTDWSRRLLELGTSADPWKIRKLMETFKLKTIKDINMLKRLVKQAETDHYSLYRAYVFLLKSGNSDILLTQMKAEGSCSSDIMEVIEDHLQSLADGDDYRTPLQLL